MDMWCIQNIDMPFSQIKRSYYIKISFYNVLNYAMTPSLKAFAGSIMLIIQILQLSKPSASLGAIQNYVKPFYSTSYALA
jgi:hypothetical protein